MTDFDNNSANQTSRETNQILSSSIKLPKFWISNPKIWFYQVEGQFSLNKIRSDRLKYAIIAALPLKSVSNIIDI